MVAWGLHTKLPKHSGLPSVQRLKAKPEKPFHELQEYCSSMSQSQGTAGLALLAELKTAVSGELHRAYDGYNNPGELGLLEDMISALRKVIDVLNRNYDLTDEIADELPYDDMANLWLPRVIQTTKDFKQWVYNAQIPVGNTHEGDAIGTFALWMKENAYVPGSAYQQRGLQQPFGANETGAKQYLYELFEYLKVVEEELDIKWHGMYVGLEIEFLGGPANEEEEEEE